MYFVPPTFSRLSLSFVILIDSSMGSPVHVLMLSIQSARGLPRLRISPGIVFSALSFFQATPLFPHGIIIVCYSLLALTASNSSLFTPALLRTHSSFFFVVHETSKIFLSPFISKASNVFLHSFWVSSFHNRTFNYVATGHTNAFTSCIFVEIGMPWLFHILIAWPLFNLVRNSVVRSPSSV